MELGVTGVLRLSHSRDATSCAFRLTNSRAEPYAFLAVSSEPHLYRFNPSTAVVLPGQALDVVVAFHGGGASTARNVLFCRAVDAEMANLDTQPELFSGTNWVQIGAARRGRVQLEMESVDDDVPSDLEPCCELDLVQHAAERGRVDVPLTASEQ